MNIAPAPDNPQYVISVRGVGYKFNEENRSYNFYLHDFYAAVFLLLKNRIILPSAPP